MTATSIRDRLQWFYGMRQAISVADQSAASKGKAGVATARAARALLASAESHADDLDSQLAVMTLLRQAMVFAASALVSRQTTDGETSSISALWDQVTRLTSMRSTIEELSPEATAAIAKLFDSGIGIEISAWSAAELRVLNQTLLRLVRRMVTQLEEDINAPRRLRAKRALRWIGSVTLLAVLVALTARSTQGHRHKPGTNMALEATVTMSSNYSVEQYPPKRLVDGDKTQLGCHSEGQLNPWAMLDLGAVERIERVVVTNRTDGLTGRALPLFIEVSSDGKTFSSYARQDNDFTTWTATGAPVEARYVRLTALANTLLHLNEVEVY